MKTQDLPDEQRTAQYFFDGKWVPDMDSSEIGPDNFSEMQNMKYSDTGPVGTPGYTKRTSTDEAFLQYLYTEDGTTLYTEGGVGLMSEH